MMLIYGRIEKSKKRKVPKAQREQHDEWLNSVNSMTTNFSKGRTIKKSVKPHFQKNPLIRETPRYPSLDSGIGVATKSAPKVYTGDKIKGIATMHKSNAVPVFTNEQAIEISSMRR